MRTTQYSKPIGAIMGTLVLVTGCGNADRPSEQLGTAQEAVEVSTNTASATPYTGADEATVASATSTANAQAATADAVAQAVTIDPVRAGDVHGSVFEDRNRNGQQDWGERGVAGVLVSNGREVVRTNAWGRYDLPAYEDMIVFYTKPVGYKTPVDANNLPQFYYLHRPNGSPAYIQKYPGIRPTGPLPKQLNFPVYRKDEDRNFKAVVMGDTQVTNDTEITYFRDSIVQDLLLDPNQKNYEFAMFLGDEAYNKLEVYPRYINVLRQLGMPLYTVPGNHDENFDSPNDTYSLETYSSYFGPNYYSFDISDEHFVVLDTVMYDSNNKYHGEVSKIEMEWLKADLDATPRDRLIVLAMHIPIVNHSSVAVTNASDLYALLKGRNVVALSGHTHTQEHFNPGDLMGNWTEPTPFPQLIAGASCGAWWSGAKDETGIPESYMSDGAPKGYFLFDFMGTHYTERFKTPAKSTMKQMNIAFSVPSANATDATDASVPSLPAGMLDAKLIGATFLTANVWDAKSDARIEVQFDDMAPITAARDTELRDPYALALPNVRSISTSQHLWKAPLPSNLAAGSHHARVTWVGELGQRIVDVKAFEISAL